MERVAGASAWRSPPVIAGAAATLIVGSALGGTLTTVAGAGATLLVAHTALGSRAGTPLLRRGILGLAVAAAALAVASSVGPAAAAAATAFAGVALLAVAATIAEARQRDGGGVLIEATLAAGVVAFVGRAAGLEVATTGVAPMVQVVAISAALLALFAAGSLAMTPAPGRHEQLVFVAAGFLIAGSVAGTSLDLGGAALADRAVDVARTAAGGLLALYAVIADRWAPLGPSPRRIARVSFARLALVVAAVSAGPATLAGVAAGRSPVPTSSRTVVALTALGVLGVVHLARLLDQRSHLEHLALHDELTGLPNRALFVDRLDRALVEPSHAEEQTSVMFIDVDRFKKVNDSLGHPAGDGLLREVATRLREEVRDLDTVARLGGDEFGVLLPGCDDSVAGEIADRILRVLSEPVAVLGHEVFVSASIGIAVAPGDGRDSLALLKNADAAMYAAKDDGRRRWKRYHVEMNATAEERLDLEAALHRALESDEGLVVHYQPKVDLSTGRIIGAEALVRWHHPTRGMLMPSEFVPLAEDTGLIVALGEWVLLRTCADLKRWTDEGLSPVVVSVNLSARQFEHHSVADIVARALRATGLEPLQLELELTESLALQDSDRVVAVLNDIRALGVSCSIDDFGTGYSGLNYLTRFPIDRLKIDKSFIAQIEAGGRDAGLVAAVIAMAHGLGLGVVAEGVETDAQAAFLRTHGCDQMQGYLVSRPIPATAFESLLSGQGLDTGEPMQVALASVHVLRRNANAATPA